MKVFGGIFRVRASGDSALSAAAFAEARALVVPMLAVDMKVAVETREGSSGADVCHVWFKCQDLKLHVLMLRGERYSFEIPRYAG